MPGAEEPGLGGLHILVTRPAGQSASLIEHIQSIGGTAYHFPLIEIEPIQPCPESLQRIAEFDLLIFVSRNAVECALPCLSGDWSSVKLAAVGQGTATVLAEHGRPADCLPKERFDSEGLLAIDELQSISGQKILIVRGVGGREHLAETLRERGALVDYAEVYRRLPTSKALNYDRDEIDVILITSSEALEHLQQIAQNSGKFWLLEKPLVVLHERIAGRAGELGFTLEPVVAKQATESALLDALQSVSRRG